MVSYCIALYCILFYFILTIHVFYTYTPDTVKKIQIHRHHYTPVFAAYLSLGLRPAPVEAQHGLSQAIHYHGDWKCGWMNCCQARPMQMIFRSGCNFCKQLSNATGLEATWTLETESRVAFSGPPNFLPCKKPSGAGAAPLDGIKRHCSPFKSISDCILCKTDQTKRVKV